MTDVNTFPMPWLMTAETAARKIIRALQNKKKVLQFPLANSPAHAAHTLGARLDHGPHLERLHRRSAQTPHVSGEPEALAPGVRGALHRARNASGSPAFAWIVPICQLLALDRRLRLPPACEFHWLILYPFAVLSE